MRHMLILLTQVLLAAFLPATQNPSLTLEERRELEKEVEQIGREAVQLRREGRWDEAYGLGREAFDREVELLGERAWDVAGEHQFLADCLEHLGELEQAREHLEQVVDIAGDYPEQRWWQTKAKGFLAAFDLRRQARPEDLARLWASEANKSKIVSLSSAKRFDEALPLAVEQLAACEAVYGPEHEECALALHELGYIQAYRRKFPEAEEYWERALIMREKVLGEDHPLYGESLNNLALVWTSTGRHYKALPLLETSARITERIRGADSAEYRLVLGTLQSCYLGCQDMVGAERTAEKRLGLFEEAFGVGDHRCVEAMGDLAHTRLVLGRYAEAMETLEECLAILRSRRRPDPRDLVLTLVNLASAHHDLGGLPRARELLEEAVVLAEAEFGKDHTTYALHLNNLAAIARDSGDGPRAIELLRQALDIAARDLGTGTPLYISALTSLAVALGERGEWEESLQLVEEARGLYLKNGEQNTPTYAAALGNHIALYAASGRLDQALEYGREAERIARAQGGELHLKFIPMLANLGAVSVSAGDLDRAEAYLREALEIVERRLDPRHTRRAEMLHSLGAVTYLRGDPKAAAGLFLRALEVRRGHLDLVAAAQSERQQLSVLGETRAALDIYLSTADWSEQTDTERFEQIMAWKGSVIARQLRQRRFEVLPELAETFEKLQGATDRYASLALADPAEMGPNHRTRLDELARERESLERHIASRRSDEAPSGSTSPGELRNCLPPGVALVDFLVYRNYEFGDAAGDAGTRFEVQSIPHLVAFILRNDAPVVRIELGPYERIEALASTWRGELQGSSYDPGGSGLSLRKAIWDPLAEALGESELVLLSPDRALARIPFGALPGRDSRGFLVQEVAVSTVAAPQLIPALLERGGSDSAPSLLAVGAVDYDATPARSASGEAPAIEAGYSSPGWRGPVSSAGLSALWPFPELAGSGPEARSVVRQFVSAFPDVDPETGVFHMTGSAAGEAAVRLAVRGTRFVHLATHGFFTAASESSPSREKGKRELIGLATDRGQEIVGGHPGLRSGLVLAGANSRRGSVQDDGLLTAIELATLDLRGVDLLTLSACDTGMGSSAGGEGLLGLQRAGQISGARAVLASLWKVDDRVAVEWMERYYSHLWEDGLSRLEAFREVQLARIRAREHPRHWAAWVLSGDWR